MTLTVRLDNLPVLFADLPLDKLSEQEREKIARIDAVLPQTQCGLCGHQNGCLPYAHGIVANGEAVNLCVPGGQAVTDAIAAIMQVPSLPATPSKWQTDPQTQRPAEVRAVIDEPNCIGCTKCIPACPVDAIIGTAKHSHSIITELCTGCELCLAPCPVDCIELVPHSRTLSDSERAAEQAHLRGRYHQHLTRLAGRLGKNDKPVVSAVESALVNAMSDTDSTAISEDSARHAIAAAKLRTQIKKLSKQLAARPSDALQAKLTELQKQLDDLGV
ncbi:iron-sulfur protein [Moraxella caviae]|uniref:Iron-sulfur protein n=1 Tax=Moraxella caviae TaxID=34060 RepID=A0A1S9ZT48_9GAMM|nr:RnfABCDGE type electron transport complex subunit B [Moraxella caviae]OOR86573.1 iron-sulfur protein [Moraxella caviae]STZ14747.1 Nitrogen fixation protein rnfB [Moraxella caviae]VEW14009.1 Nitrogen fixation protein rnfB [Moraxella caviae]